MSLNANLSFYSSSPQYTYLRSENSKVPMLVLVLVPHAISPQPPRPILYRKRAIKSNSPQRLHTLEPIEPLQQSHNRIRSFSQSELLCDIQSGQPQLFPLTSRPPAPAKFRQSWGKGRGGGGGAKNSRPTHLLGPKLHPPPSSSLTSRA